jgi:hypothetical protein
MLAGLLAIPGMAKGLAIAGAVVACIVAYGLWLHEHDDKIIAEQTSLANAEVAHEQQVHSQATIAALQGSLADAKSRSAQSVLLKQAIANAPKSVACINSPVVSAYLGSLRANPDGGSAAGQPADGNVAVPAAAPGAAVVH